MKVLLLTSHSIAEHDDLRMLTDLGYDVFSIGAYTNPLEPNDDARPPLDVPTHPQLEALCIEQREKHADDDPSFVIDWAKGDLHPDLLDWADVIICHHFPQPWLIAQWHRLREKRVIWRTCGQSDPDVERAMMPLRIGGLEVVRYSPKEKIAFEKYGAFAGEDAIIRFGKYPDDWDGWTGEISGVLNITQKLYQRHPATNWEFWEVATADLPRLPAGEGSDILGGPGRVTYDEMRGLLTRYRAYLYTGTQPASYTLGFIEAMMTGIPTISIGPSWMVYPDLLETHELTGFAFENPEDAASLLRLWLNDEAAAREVGTYQRDVALREFGIEVVGPQWVAYLGEPTREGVV